MLFLNIPYIDKDLVKQCGARWNPELKKWYVPYRRNYNKFGYWLANKTPDDVIIIFDYFYLIKSFRNCYKCGNQTPVIGFAFDNYVLLTNEQYEKDCEYYDNHGELDLPEPEIKPVPYAFTLSSPAKELCIISDIAPVTTLLKDTLKNDFNYFPSYSHTVQRKYSANHCSFCKALQGNNFLYEDIFDSPFNISDPDVLANIGFTKIKLPCDIAITPEWCVHFNSHLHYYIRPTISDIDANIPDLSNLPEMPVPFTLEALSTIIK